MPTIGSILVYPYEVRSEQEYFDEIQDVKVTKDMLDLAKHIVNQKAGRFDPEKFEDHYETALIDLINKKRAGKPITPKERPAAGTVVDLMEALRRSVGKEAAPAKAAKPTKKPRKASSGQKEMLMPIEGKKPKEAAAKKSSARRSGSQRRPALLIALTSAFGSIGNISGLAAGSTRSRLTHIRHRHRSGVRTGRFGKGKSSPACRARISGIAEG